MNLPYVTHDLPGFGGTLRATPDDFSVEEIPLYEPTGEGQHLYVRLTKAGMTTKEVQQRLARLLQLERRAVSFAGMKDKHARTTQTFSINIGHQADEFAAEAEARLREGLADLPVTLHWVQRHRNKLKLGHLLGNRFTIRITGLDIPIDEAASRAEAIAAQIGERGVPNYFGPQRFGASGDNAERGLAIIRKEQWVSDRWLRRFLMSAYQSHLCNRYLALRLERDLFDGLVLGDFAKKVDTGGLFVVEDLAAEQLRYAAHEISFTAPMYGSKMRAAQADAAALEDEVLAEAEVSLADLQRVKLNGTRRLGRLLPKVEIDSTDDPAAEVDGAAHKALTLCFSLPKGAFATTVLREFTKQDVFVDGDDVDDD